MLDVEPGQPTPAPARLAPPLTVCLSLVLVPTADAYYGQNNKIRETLNNLILKSPQEWQTTVGLPFVRIEGARQPAHASSRPAPTLVDRG